MRIVFKLMSIFWVTSPAWYLLLRLTGQINHPFDVPIYFALCLVSWFVCLMSYQSKNEEDN